MTALTIPYNGEPCDNCGHHVYQLDVDVTLVRGARRFRANCTTPCGCLHAVIELPLTSGEFVKSSR